MDERIERHAAVLVDWSARVEAGDDVVVSVDEGAHELGVAVAAALGERGANLLATYGSDELTRAYVRAHEGAFDADPAFELALYERADVVLRLGGTTNTSTWADVSGDRRAAYRRARQGITTARLATDWVSTIHPTRAHAQQAGMSYEAYRSFVYDAILIDWASLADEMANLKTRLDDGKTVRIEAPGTDLTLSIANRVAVNSAASVAYDSHNLPSGEVFTAPADANGQVTFDLPMTIEGRQVRDLVVTFEDGRVVDVAAGRNGDVVEELLETDAGADRIGELGFGMNRQIDRLTNNILLDEKMGDTVHLAVGRPYAACFPDGEPSHESAVHADFIASLGTDARVLIDGEVVNRNGRYVWEDESA